MTGKEVGNFGEKVRGYNTSWPDKHSRVLLVLVKRDLFSVRYCTSVHWTSHVLQGTSKTRSCITGHPVIYQYPGPGVHAAQHCCDIADCHRFLRRDNVQFLLGDNPNFDNSFLHLYIFKKDLSISISLVNFQKIETKVYFLAPHNSKPTS